MDFNPATGIPMIALDTSPHEFDYGAFLEEEGVDVDVDVDIDYLAEDSSASGTSRILADGSIQTLVPLVTNRAVSGSGRSKTPSPTNSTGNSPPKQRLERRGHTKSRRGCFNCKRRRIKVRHHLAVSQFLWQRWPNAHTCSVKKTGRLVGTA